MYLMKNGDETTVLVNDEAAENILAILGFDNEKYVGAIWCFSDEFMKLITAAMESVVVKTGGDAHDTIMLTETEAHDMIIELFYFIVCQYSKVEIAAIRDLANTRYAALLGENGLLPAMVAAGIVEKEVSDTIYRYNGNDDEADDEAFMLLLNHVKDIPGAAIRYSFIGAYGRYLNVCSAVHKSVVFPTDPNEETDSDQVEDDNNTTDK